MRAMCPVWRGSTSRPAGSRTAQWESARANGEQLTLLPSRRDPRISVQCATCHRRRPRALLRRRGGRYLWCHCQSSSSARDQSEQSSRRRLADAIGTEALTLFRGIGLRTSPHNPVGGLALRDGVRYTLGLHANLMRLPRAARPFPSMSEHLLVSAMPPRTAVDVHSGPAPQ